jgi:hypothetical protein
VATAQQNKKDNCPDNRHRDGTETTEAVGEEGEHSLQTYRGSGEARLLRPASAANLEME